MAQMQALRREIRAKGGRLKVAKNRLVKRAIDQVDGACDLDEHLKDQLGIVFAADEFTDVVFVIDKTDDILDPSIDYIFGSLDVMCLNSYSKE